MGAGSAWSVRPYIYAEAMVAAGSDDMTRLGFVLASDSCIGCHACTVACKSEHDVPLGVNRTWVKYIETGEFPDHRAGLLGDALQPVRRRAVHRDLPDPGAVPRANGVVDFDDSRCIGCKACMNACPYDAIYINPETNTAQKCNFCNHRVEVGLEPACVIVCPTQRDHVRRPRRPDVGDQPDRGSRPTSPYGRPEQGTRPKVFYRGPSQAALDPLRTAIRPTG